MEDHSNQKVYKADEPKGYSVAAQTNVQLGKWGEIDPEDHFDRVKEMVSENSNEKEYLEGHPPSIHYKVIGGYDKIAAAQLKQGQEERKWGEIAFEDSPAGVHHAMHRDTDIKSYQNDEPHGLPGKLSNLMTGKWGEIAEEDTTDYLKDIISSNSHEGDYIEDGPKGYNAIPYDKIVR